MIERGLEPDFSPRRARRARSAARSGAARPRDCATCASLLWGSIDNDDSRDLDQLSRRRGAAEAARRGSSSRSPTWTRSCRRARRSTGTRGTTRRRSTRRREIFPMLPERLSTDLTSLNEDEDRLAVVVEMVVDADGAVAGSEVYRARGAQPARSSPTTASRAWLEGDGADAAAGRAVARARREAPAAGRASRRGCARCGTSTARSSLETIEPRPVFDGDESSTCASSSKNRAQRADRGLHDRGQRRHGALPRGQGVPVAAPRRALARALGRIVELAAEHGRDAARRARREALEAFLAQPAQGRSAALSRPVALDRQADGRGRVRRRAPGADGRSGTSASRCGTTRTRRRRTGAIPTSSRSGCSRPRSRAAAPVFRPRSSSRSRAHCTEQEDDADKVERQVRKSAAALLLEGRIGERFDGVVTGASEKGTWVRVLHPAGRRARSSRAAEGSTSATGCA